MKNKIVAIGLFPDRIDLLVCQGGRVSASRRLPVTFETSAEEWLVSLRKAGPMLTDTVREMKIEGWSAVVAYANPTAVSEFASVKASSPSEACDAAVLTISDSLGYPLALAVTGAAVIARDTDRQKGQTHVVVTAERDDHAVALMELIELAGLKFESATPIDAALMMRVATSALKSDSPRSAHLYLGEQRSFFVIIENGSLAFARPINLGIHTMATCLTRPLRGVNGGEPVELDLASARNMLREHGFPDRQQIVHNELGLTGAQIIPLLQPVLQRFMVELRQSLRFGVAEEHRQSVTINFTGPGSSIPGFASIVSNELKLEVAVDKVYADFDDRRSDSHGCELMDAMTNHSVLAKLNLQPREVAQKRQTNRMLRWMWTGAAAALIVVGIDAFRCRANLQSVRDRAEKMAARNAEAQSLQASSAKMISAIEAMTALDNSIATQVGAQVNFRSCMQEIASLVPSSIRLTEIRFSQIDNRTTGSLLGYAFPGDPAVRKTELESFISKLRSSPLFDSVALGNVQIASVQSRSAEQFEVSMTSIAAPKDQMAQASAAPATGVPAGAQVQAQEGSPR